MTPQPIVIYGVGSPIAIDAEETCLRLRRRIVAGVLNVAGQSYVSEKVAVVQAADAGYEVKRCEIVLPMFTPAHPCRKDQSLHLGLSADLALAMDLAAPGAGLVPTRLDELLEALQIALDASRHHT